MVITCDENGGFWDHAAPPKADRWGLGSRVSTLIISPYAQEGYVDHAQYDRTSTLRFITKRFDLQQLDGLKARDEAIVCNGKKPIGDLPHALRLSTQ